MKILHCAVGTFAMCAHKQNVNCPKNSDAGPLKAQ